MMPLQDAASASQSLRPSSGGSLQTNVAMLDLIFQQLQQAIEPTDA